MAQIYSGFYIRSHSRSLPKRCVIHHGLCDHMLQRIWPGGVCPGECLPGGCFPRGVSPRVSAQEGCGRHPPGPETDTHPCRQTDTCENITFANYVCGGNKQK